MQGKETVTISLRVPVEISEIVRFATSVPGSEHSNVTEFVLDALQEKIERDGLREKYDAVVRVLEEIEGKEPAEAEHELIAA